MRVESLTHRWKPGRHCADMLRQALSINCCLLQLCCFSFSFLNHPFLQYWTTVTLSFFFSLLTRPDYLQDCFHWYRSISWPSESIVLTVWSTMTGQSSTVGFFKEVHQHCLLVYVCSLHPPVNSVHQGIAEGAPEDKSKSLKYLYHQSMCVCGGVGGGGGGGMWEGAVNTVTMSFSSWRMEQTRTVGAKENTQQLWRAIAITLCERNTLQKI